MQSITDLLPPRQSASQQHPEDVFESTRQSTSKKIEIKRIADESEKPGDVAAGKPTLPAEDVGETPKGSESAKLSEVVVVEGGFGKIQPQVVEQTPGDVEPDEDWASRGFASIEELKKGRLSENEMRQLDVFKNYDPGEPTTRLYIKNLGKKTVEADLRYVFGRYVDWNNEAEKTMFYVQLLTGRMKGQAFITLPSEDIARQALTETNGFQVNDKAMVVQFARSLKPKDKDGT